MTTAPEARTLLLCAALSGFLAVALGAFGAHALGGSLPAARLAAYQTGVHYHGLHTVAVLVIGLLSLQWPGATWIRRSGWLMLLGILLFSGSLYLLALTGIPGLGLITPLGGLSLLAGWAALAYALARLPKSH